MEDRTLLSVSGLFIAGELSLVADGPDDITIREDQNNTGQVEVLVNQSPLSTLPSLNAADVTSIIINGSDQANTIDVSGVTMALFSQLSQPGQPPTIVINAGNGNDSIIGSADLADDIRGDDGRDTIRGNGGNDILDGGNGNDSVFGGDGNDTMEGGDGNDALIGDAGDDVITGGDGVDVLSGNDGDDELRGGDDNDVLNGNAGSDELHGDSGDDQLLGEDGNDFLFGEIGDDLLIGADGIDMLNGNAGNDVLQGDDGNDFLFGGSGKDLLSGNDGDDYMNGNSGNDTLLGDRGTDPLDEGMDTLIGGANDDLLLGDLMDDTIRGQAGDDTICGGGGADFMDGGTGDDFVQSICDTVTVVPEISITDAAARESGSGDVVFVIDISGSTGSSFGGTSVGDVNNDGQPNTVLDGELAGFIALNDDFVANSDNLRIAIITFNSNAFQLDMDPVAPGLQLVTTPTADLDNNGIFDVEDVLRSITIFGGTNFQPPLALTLATFATLNTPADEGTMVFISDGSAPINFTAEVAALNMLGIRQRAFGAGSGANLGALQQIDPMAQIFLTTDELIAGLMGVVQAPGEESITFTLTLSEPNSIPVTVQFETLDGTATGNVDYQEADGQITFAPGEVAKTVTLRLLPDAAIEPTENFFVILSNAVGATILDGVGEGTIVGTGASLPAFLMADIIFDEGNTGTTTAVFTLELSQASTQMVTVDFATQDGTAIAGTDYTTTMGTVTFPPGDTQATFTVPISGDMTPEPDDVFFVVLSNPSNAVILDVLTLGIIRNDDGTVPILIENDTLFGGAGDDTLQADGAIDFLNGQGGNDILFGGDGTDTLLGGSGNDLLDGEGGDDLLDGQSGMDTVQGNVGDDTFVWGGASDGSDRYESLSGADVVEIRGDKSANTFTVTQQLVLSASGSTIFDAHLQVTDGSATLTVDNTIREVIVNGGNGDDIINLTNINVVPFTQLTINGGNGNDTVNGTGVALGDVRLRINGNAGNDVLTGTDGDDTISGGNDNDQLFGGLGNDTIFGDLGDDLLDGQDGDDSLLGGIGNDTIMGGDGNDHLLGEADNDFLLAGAGNDTIEGNAGRDTLNGNSGNDSLDGGRGQDTLFGGSGNDTLNGGHNDDSLKGHSGNDQLIGSHGDDVLKGNSGNDTIKGGDGDDTIEGNDGNDVIGGFDGDDLIRGNAGNDSITAGEGNDNVFGGDGDDGIMGDEGDDTLDGELGTDTIASGEGVDNVADPAEDDPAFTLSQTLLDLLNAL